ncbi:MAG: radical SAM protein [Dethiosulfatibacter sp.]|nr:radical SAM protein [Dethiosulfatibacter sp.]
MKYITRKSMLYKTGVEYGDYTMNHVAGCSHGCKYPCYAFLMAKRFGKVKSYKEWTEPFIVCNTIELLQKEIPRLKNKIESVQLCFTTDPFMVGHYEIEEMSLAAIKLLNSNGIKCIVLTKGTLPEELVETSSENEYGITFISLDEEYRKKTEPGAASYGERLKALKYLHDKGCKTWVSIEPYPTPNLIEQDLRKILKEVAFTNKIIFGRTNYNKDISSYKEHVQFYNQQAKIVIDFCKERNIVFHIKEGTVKDE